LPKGDWIPVGAGLGAVADLAGGTVSLAPWQPLLARKRD